MRAALLLVSTVILAACNMAADAQRGEAAAASGAGTQRSYQVGAFDSISLAGHHNVVVTVGGAPSVRAEGDERELDDLEISTQGNSLRIGQRRNSNRSFGHDREAVTVHVTLPALANVSIGGSGDMRIDTVQGRSFGANIGGSGNIEIASLRVEEARFAVAGSGNIRASGEAGTSNISVAGSGDVDLGNVQSRSAEVSVMGSGDVRVRASETANVSVMGSGDVAVIGQARCNVRKMGSGEVSCNA